MQLRVVRTTQKSHTINKQTQRYNYHMTERTHIQIILVIVAIISMLILDQTTAGQSLMDQQPLITYAKRADRDSLNQCSALKTWTSMRQGDLLLYISLVPLFISFCT